MTLFPSPLQLLISTARSARRTTALAFVIATAAAAACSSEDATTVTGLDEDGRSGSGGQTGGGGSAGADPGGSAGVTSADAGVPASGAETLPTARFVGPGLQVTLERVLEEPVFAVEFTLTDGDGRALDREGVLTSGAVATNFLLSRLEETPEGATLQYRSYVTSEQTSPIGMRTETQAASDSGGTYEVVDATAGRYRYVFATPIHIAETDRDLTHVVGVYATRTHEGTRHVDNQRLPFVPDGGNVRSVEIVTDTACNGCHTRVEAHGGARRGVQTCVLCHNASDSIDPDTGNSIDFHIMIHKIHRGSDLPSVIAGDPYQIVGFRQSVHDYGQVEFPGNLLNCEGCHAGTDGDRWSGRFTIAACSSCHDRSYFGQGAVPEGYTAHAAGPRSESECVVCHQSGSIAPVTQYHGAAVIAPPEPRLVVAITGLGQTAPGQTPIVAFSASVGGQPRNVIAERMDRLRLVVAGPNTDYETVWMETFTDAPACGDPIVPPCLEPNGSAFRYHASTPIPADAAGSYTASMEARIAVDGVRHLADNPVYPFLVTGSEVTPRRKVVDLEHCNSCHQTLEFHGGNRRTPDYCVMCHNPAFVSDEPPAETTTSSFPSLNFKDLIHGLHSQGHYPDALQNCGQCHLDGTAELPLSPGHLPSLSLEMGCNEDPGADEDDECAEASVVELSRTLLPPTAAACLSCHESASAAAHAEVNTTASGAESCATCHQNGRSEGLDSVHALEP